MSDPEVPLGSHGEDEPLVLSLEEEPVSLEDEEAEAPFEDDTPGRLLAAATAWADLVLMLAVCALAVAGVRLLALPLSAAIFPWACGLGVLAWTVSAAVLLATRRSWPGALMLGLVLPTEYGNGHLGRRLALILLAALTVGLAPATLARFDPWAGLVPERTL